MDILSDLLTRGIEQLLGRSDGPLFFRLYIMPAVASIIGIRSGFRDAAKDEPPIISKLIGGAIERKVLFYSGWKDVGRIVVMALVLDTIYQLVVFRAFYVFQTIIVALLCAVLPYLVCRGLTNRVICLVSKKRADSDRQP